MTRALWIMLIAPAAMLAHADEPLRPAWQFDFGVIIPLALSALLYARGMRIARILNSLQTACFWAGWAVLAIALISPLHALGEVLFWPHMVQHELLMLIAAPLLVLSRPLVPLLWGLPFEWRRAIGRWPKATIAQRVWRKLTRPLWAWSIHAAVLWGWHAPALFQATLRSELAHAAQHSSFLFSALLFWWSMLYARSAAVSGTGVVYIFTTAVHTSILGALLTFTPAIWYPAYARTAPQWGWTPLEDQQLGGLIMWIPAGLVYLGIGLALFAAWLRDSDRGYKSRRYAD